MTPVESARWLTERDNILIITHRRPDGDTIGCAAALCIALRRAGKQAYVLYNPETTPVNRTYVELFWAPDDFAPDAVVTMDIAAKSLFPDNAEPYLDRVDLAIDHHPSQEFFAENTCLDASCAACGEIVYEVCLELGEITQAIAVPLYMAIATDTGCFIYANTTAKTHVIAAELLKTGIDFAAIHKRHFRSKSRRRVLLEAEMLVNPEFFLDDRGVFLFAPLSLTERLGVTEDDTDDLPSLANQFQGLDCAVTLREIKENQWKVSLRTGTDGRVNANWACALLGGGGHAMAAGAVLEGGLEEVKAKVRDAIEQVRAY